MASITGSIRSWIAARTASLFIRIISFAVRTICIRWDQTPYLTGRPKPGTRPLFGVAIPNFAERREWYHACSHSPHLSPFTSASSPKMFNCVTGACAFVVHSQYNLWSKLPDLLLIGAFSHHAGSPICSSPDIHFVSCQQGSLDTHIGLH